MVSTNNMEMKESCRECSEGLGACPFNFFSEKADQVQNYGCLPTPMDIVNMRINHGKTWACHSNPDKPCLGALNYLKDKVLPFEVIDKELITESHHWEIYTK